MSAPTRLGPVGDGRFATLRAEPAATPLPVLREHLPVPTPLTDDRDPNPPHEEPR